MAPGAANTIRQPDTADPVPARRPGLRDPPVYGAERYGRVKATSSAGSPRALIAITMYCLPSIM